MAMASYGVLMYLDLQSFCLQGFQGYSKGCRFFDSAIQNNTQNAQDFFFESLVNIVEPTRQAMRLKCQSTDVNFKLDKASQIKSVSIEINFYAGQFYLRRNRSP